MKIVKSLQYSWLILCLFALFTGCKTMPENTEQRIHVAKHTINSALKLNLTLRDKVDFEKNLNYLKRSRATVDLIEAFDSKTITRGEACTELAKQVVKQVIDIDPDYFSTTIRDLCTNSTVTPESMLLLLNNDLQNLLIELQRIEENAKLEGGG